AWSRMLLIRRSFPRQSGGRPATSEGDPTWFDRLMSNMRDHAAWLPLPALETEPEDSPGLMQVLASSLNIMQDRIMRSRMAGDPPDLVIAPRLDHIGLLEFDRAREAIAEGEACVDRLSSAIEGFR
ncbi:MAG: patatin, partial [Candidatus Hydrogenedentota bacterium]